MDQIISAGRSLKREPESDDQNEACKVLIDEYPNKDVQTNSSTSSSKAAPTLPSFFKCHWDYDVFLSFRGEDTRRNFTDHLYSAMKRVGIRTFRDDEELQRGENISTELLNTVRRSKIFIVVFSKGYASSRWCLDELVEIMYRKNTMDHTLFPIFYHVDPSDIRKQTGTFAEAFAMHEEQFQTDMKRVQEWRKALTEAANCSGWDLKSVEDGYESRFINKIVEELLCRVNHACMHVAMYPIGIDSRVEEMKDLLDLKTSDIISIVGIYGMGRIGKTTLAKAVYNQICDGFEGSSCLLNIKETSDLVSLQKQLLLEILKKNLTIHNVDEGIKSIENRCRGKKVLVVMDDVDHMKQLQALVRNSKWFGPGSRIIVTTRDERLLTEFGVHKKYKVEKLNYMESLRLFSPCAFNMVDPTEDYHELLISAVEHAEELPLALEVLGSHFLDKSVFEWKSGLEKLQRIPNKNIQDILRLSFESLDIDIKNIFLDIACFFIGMKKEYAIKILHGCGFFPDEGLGILIQRSLVTIDIEMKLRMHDLIRDMGREIVCKESPHDLGEHTRLWFHEDVLNVLSKQTGSKLVQGLILNLPELGDRQLKTEAFAEMKNLRLLQINAVSLTGCYRHLPKDLRWLCWRQCPLKFLPLDFHLENLVVLDMEHSNVKQIWNDNRVLNKLKVLNLSYSKNLTKSPNFLQVPHLEMLILEGCINLVELHQSIGHLKNLVLLNLKECKNLWNLPRSIYNLNSLERLNLSGCKGQFSQSWLSSFSLWISPKSLNPISLLRASVFGFFSLGRLVLSNSNLSEDEMLIDIERLSSLQFLDLSFNNFRNLPDCISRLPKLISLDLSQCTSLHSISRLPANVESLLAFGCSSMEKLSILPGSKIRILLLMDCCKLVEIQGFPLHSGGVFNFFGCYNLSSDFRTMLLQCPSTKRDCVRFTFLPGSEVPNWVSHQTIGSPISFHVPSISSHVPSLSEDAVYILLICAVYAKEDESDRLIKICVTIHNKSRGYRQVIVPATVSYFANKSDHLFLVQWHLIRRNDALMLVSPGREMELVRDEEFELSFDLFSADLKRCVVKKCGVYLKVDEPKK